jgi:hypothetical protein
VAKIVARAGLIAIGSLFMTPALAHYRTHSYDRSYRPYLAACAAVIYPRSPVCAGIPVAYVYFPWNMIWYLPP